jgi:hypothetical protein
VLAARQRRGGGTGARGARRRAPGGARPPPRRRRLAEPLAESLGLFDAVVSTEGGVNLSGKDKCAALVARYGERGFD